MRIADLHDRIEPTSDKSLELRAPTENNRRPYIPFAGYDPTNRQNQMIGSVVLGYISHRSTVKSFLRIPIICRAEDQNGKMAMVHL